MKHSLLPLLWLVFCLPLHAQESDFWRELVRRDALVGESSLFNNMKTSLEDHGLYYELLYTGEVFYNASGGIQDGRGRYRGDISLFLELNTEEAGWWDGGTFFLQLQHQHGQGITEDFVGDFEVLSNIDADNFTQLSEFWYRHDFMDGRLWMLFGKMEANAYFAYTDFGGEFLHSSPGFSPTIPLTTYPDQDWGFVLGIEPTKAFSINVGVYQAPPDGGRSIGNLLDELGGPMLMAEPAYHYSLNGNPGHLRLGAWWNGVDFDRLDASPARSAPYDDSYGFYATWDQTLWRENPEDDNDEQGVGVFAQYGWAPPTRSEARQYYGFGVQWTGAIPDRDDDILGAGVFHVDFSDYAGFAVSSETPIEVFYKFQWLGWMSLKPDLQYIMNPGGAGAPDALVFGLRWELSF
ncbi:MAG: hypothetical protein GC154_18300 [bacterium]|nr:hypothetical protein [bacterium]